MRLRAAVTPLNQLSHQEPSILFGVYFAIQSLLAVLLECTVVLFRIEVASGLSQLRIRVEADLPNGASHGFEAATGANAYPKM